MSATILSKILICSALIFPIIGQAAEESKPANPAEARAKWQSMSTEEKAAAKEEVKHKATEAVNNWKGLSAEEKTEKVTEAKNKVKNSIDQIKK